MRFWQSCPAPGANLKSCIQLWRSSWSARLLPQGGFLPFFICYGGKEVPFIALCASLARELSVPHVLASHFTVRNTFPSPPSLGACGASCYCHSKTSSFFPLRCGLCMLSLVLPAFANPKRKRIEGKGPSFCSQTQNLSYSRAAGASAAMYVARVPSLAALWIWPCL